MRKSPKALICLASNISGCADNRLSSLNLSSCTLCGVYIDQDGYAQGIFDSAGKQLDIQQEFDALISLGYVGLIALADTRALLSLNLAKNSLCAEGTKLLAEMLKGNTIVTELNVSSNTMTYGGMSGVVALADAIPDMGAMTSLNLRWNDLGVEGAKTIAACLPKCT
jgi:hypothetical protein